MKLADLIELNPRLTLKKGSPAPFIEMAALPTNEKFVRQVGQREVTGSGAKFQNGDTLFARITPCLENGKGGYIAGLPDGSVGQGSTEFIVFRAKDKADEQFAYYLSRYPKFRDFAEQGMEGTSGRQRVTWQTLAEFELSEIGGGERTALGEVLSSLDDKIELNRRMNETLEEMARALFRDWFVDFGPTRRQMEGATNPAAIMGQAFPPEKAATLAPLFPAKLGDDGLPEGWKQRVLHDLTDWVNGAAYKNMHFSTEPDALPVVKIVELKAGVTKNTKHTNTALGEKYRITNGEVLFSWSGNPDTSIDTFVWSGGEAWLNQHIFAVRPNGEVPQSVLYFLLRYLRPQFAEIARDKQTTGLGHVTKQDLRSMRVCIGTDDLLGHLTSLLEPIFQKIYANQLENRTLAQMRDLLLPKLMSGEIRLRDLEALS